MLIREVGKDRWKDVFEEDVQKGVVKYGYVTGAFQPILQNVVKSGEYMKADGKCGSASQRVFLVGKVFGATKNQCKVLFC